MSIRIASIVLLSALVGAVLFAVLRTDGSAAPKADAPAPIARELEKPQTAALPPNHPPVGAPSPQGGAMPLPPATDESAAITWKVPEGWQTLPNPNAMRIATFRVPRAPGDTEDADVTVSRAGGSTDANIQRWVGQFDDAGKDVQTVKTVRGIKITVVEVGGTFRGGGMMAGPSAPHPKWALLGAVVETKGTPYFFKLTGPAATVKAARATFDALLESITPS